MNTRFCRVMVSVLALFLGVASGLNAQALIVKPADIIVIHGRVYTENPKQPWAQAVAAHLRSVTGEIRSARGTDV